MERGTFLAHTTMDICTKRAHYTIKFAAKEFIANMWMHQITETPFKTVNTDTRCYSIGEAQLAVDVTLRCALTRTDEPHPHAADVDVAVLVRARHDKETTHPELINSGRCRLVVVAIETGGRWSDEAVEFIRLLACAKAQEVPSYMWWPTTLAWQRRWTRMLSTACSLSFAASLVEPSDSCVTWCRTGGDPPSLAELLSQDPR